MERISHSAVRCWETLLVRSVHLQTKKVIRTGGEEKIWGGGVSFETEVEIKEEIKEKRKEGREKQKENKEERM